MASLARLPNHKSGVSSIPFITDLAPAGTADGNIAGRCLGTQSSNTVVYGSRPIAFTDQARRACHFPARCRRVFSGPDRARAATVTLTKWRHGRAFAVHR